MEDKFLKRLYEEFFERMYNEKIPICMGTKDFLLFSFYYSNGKLIMKQINLNSGEIFSEIEKDFPVENMEKYFSDIKRGLGYSVSTFLSLYKEFK